MAPHPHAGQGASTHGVGGGVMPPHLANYAPGSHVPEEDLAVAAAGGKPARRRRFPAGEQRWAFNTVDSSRRGIAPFSPQALHRLRLLQAYLLLSDATATSRTS